MNGAGHADCVNFFLRQAHFYGNIPGNIRRPDLMKCRVGISHFHRGYHDLKSAVISFAQALQCLLKFFLHIFTLGDVAYDSSKTNWLSGGIFLQQDGYLNVSFSPVFSDNLPIQPFERLSRFVYIVKSFENFFSGLFIRILTVIHTHQFIFGVAMDLAH